MAKVCTNICLGLSCDGLSITDVSGLYPDKAMGWQYNPGDTAVPTTDIDSITLTVTDPESVITVYAIPSGNYTDPALPSMSIADIDMELPDGLYTFEYQIEFLTEENCATASVTTMLITKSLSCCLRSLEAKALLATTSTEYESLIKEHTKLSMELHGLLTSVNSESITDPLLVKDIIEDLSTRCKAISKNCDC